MRSPSLHHARPIAILVVALALVGYFSYLLADIYRSRSRLMALDAERTLLGSEKQAAALGYFLAERREDLIDLASHRDLLAYFENEALGMSMEYGLAASLEGAAEAFRHFRGRKRLGNQEIYDRVAFLSSQGAYLVDVRAPSAPAFPEDLPPFTGSPEADHPRLFIQNVGSSPMLVVCQPYRFKDQRRGTLLAWLSIAHSFDLFIGSKTAAKTPMALLFEKHWVHLADGVQPRLGLMDLPDPSALGERVIQDLALRSAQGVPVHLKACRVPVSDTPFSLVAFLPNDAPWQNSPGLILAMAAGIGTLLLLGAFALYREESRSRLMNARFRAIFDNAGLSLCLMDREGRFQEVNERFARLSGYPASELKHLRMVDITHPEDALRVQAFLASRFMAPDGQASIEHRFLARDGSEVWGSVHLTPLPTGPGQHPSVIALILDLTEAKRGERERLFLETQLRQAQKLEAVGQLAAGIAHEINTPIQFIRDNALFLQQSFKQVQALLETCQQAIQTLGPSQDMQTRLDRAWEDADMDYLRTEIPGSTRQIHEGTERVATIVRAMMEFASPSEGRAVMADLNHAIEGIAALSRNSWEKVADLVLDLAPDLPRIPCHLDEINQVFLSLIINAADAIGASGSETRGTITLATRMAGSEVEIRVKDTGTGIPEKIQTRIFDPFFTTKEVGQSTGQGLAIAHHVVVEKHRGRLWFETLEGHGTDFLIRLPVNRPPA